MKNTKQAIKRSSLFALPAVARRRLIIVGLGWLLVAALEALAYTVLALSIVNHWQPKWVLISAGAAVLTTTLVNRTGFLSGIRLAGDLFAQLGLSLSQAKLSWFTSEHRAQVTTLAGQGIPGLMSIPAHQIQGLLHAPGIPLFLVIGIYAIAGTNIALVAALLLILSLTAQCLSQRVLIRADSKRHETEAQTSEATLELVDHLELLRTSAGPVRAIENIEQRWSNQEKALVNTNRAAAFAVFISTLASVLPISGMASYLIYTGDNSGTMILALLVIIGRAAAPLGELATTGLSINNLRDALNNYKKATTPPTLASPEKAKAVTENFHIAINEVTHASVLNQISLDVPAGNRVLITGPSGSGKSTLLELLMRFDDPDKGQIHLGGNTLSDIHYDELTSHIAYVAQDPIVFTGSLADNIRIGSPQATESEIETIARKSALGPMIDRSPDGIHQEVGQQGKALSGGERQRVAIARALIKNAPILILDEATSALDEATEQEVVKSILALSSTVLLVTHRNSDIWKPMQTLSLGN